MSKVVWVDIEGMSFDNSIDRKLKKLIVDSDIAGNLVEGMKIALKINTAEVGYEYGLRPTLLRTIADEALKVTKKNPVICDGHKLVDYWKQSKGNIFLEVASTRGYSSDTLGGQFVINGGFSGDEGDLFSCGTESELGGVEIGTAICRSDVLWVLSHVTLHPLFGLNGALLNGGFECLSGRSKTRILNGLSPYQFNGNRPSQKDVKSFRQRAIECNKGVNTALEGRIFYINYLWDVTPHPEYYPYSERPVTDNLGFLASSDPVALDNATISIIEDNNKNLRNLGDDFRTIIEQAENLGLGKSKQTVIRIS